MSHMLDAIEDMLTVGLSEHQVCVWGRGGGGGEGVELIGWWWSTGTVTCMHSALPVRERVRAEEN